MSDLPSTPATPSPAGTAGGAAPTPDRAPRRTSRIIGRALLGAFGLVLATLLIAALARDALLVAQVLPRIGPLVGGSLSADSIHLELFPLELHATGIHLEIPQIKGPIRARSLTAALLSGHVVVEGLEVSRAEGGDRAPVLTVKTVEGTVELGKVIAPPYPVDDVRIDEPVFRARLLEPGWTNIQALLGMQKPNPAKLAPLPPPVSRPAAASAGGEPANPPAALFYLRHARLEHGTLIYDDPLSDAVAPVHLSITDVTAEVRDFQYLGAPYANPLTDVTLDGRIAQPEHPGWLHVRAWAEPWRDEPSITLLGAITGFDLRTIDPYTAGSGGAALGGNWIHALLDVKATDAKIQTGVVSVTVAETGTEMNAPFTGDLFRPTIDKNSALVSAFQLPLGHLLKMGNVSLDVAGQLAIAGLESVLRLGQGAADAGSAVGSSAPPSAAGQSAPPSGGGDDFLSSLGRGIAAFGSGVANAAKRLFQGGEQGVGTVGGFADPDRPIAEILAEFEPRHRETMRLFLRERIHVAESRDPARMASLDAELEALGPSAVVATPDRTGSATPHALGTGAATGESPPTDDLE
ncbi:MAG: hypothetical protein IPK07_02130 [Deltaproteobacteria bacterium]|nr:hypothetical protein [Deltaproteobacteria bacterium]